MLYFSYGSNMSVKRLLERVPSASKVGTGVLKGHELRFHKVSKKDGSAKCDAFLTGDIEHFIYGVIYDIDESDKPELDMAEGLNHGYDEKDVLIEFAGDSINAFTYYATKIDSTLKPLHWYKEHVLRGAREHQLPEQYIQLIELVESIPDLNIARHENEIAIYA